MIRTTVMIQLGKVEDNRMVNMQPLNEKMIDRSIKMLLETNSIKNYEEGRQLLLKFGNVKKVLNHVRSRIKSRIHFYRKLITDKILKS